MKISHLGAASALTLALGACASAPEGSAGYGEQKVYVIETSGGG